MSCLKNRTSGVERADEDSLPTVPNQLDHPLLHFARSLVGEGHRQNLPRLHTLMQQVGNPVGQYSRLTRAGPSQYKQRTIHMGGRPGLFGIQAVRYSIHRDDSPPLEWPDLACFSACLRSRNRTAAPSRTR